jgi:hypothetical protein
VLGERSVATFPPVIGHLEAHFGRIDPGAGYWRFPLGGWAGTRSCKQSNRTIISRHSNPLADSRFRNAQGSCDLSLLPAALPELPRLHPSPFPEVQVANSVNVHASLYRPENLSFLRNAQ